VRPSAPSDAEAPIAVARERRRLAPSAIGSTPGLRRARPMVPLTPLRGRGRSEAGGQGLAARFHRGSSFGLQPGSWPV
jgi:hypothetical protein